MSEANGPGWPENTSPAWDGGSAKDIVRQFEERLAAKPRSHSNEFATRIYGTDLPDGDPPRPLIADTFLAREATTVIYGNGGSGKGLVCVWLAHEYLVAYEDDVACLDFERHPDEWGNRQRRMGYTPEQRERFHHVTIKGRLAERIESVKSVLADFRVGLLIVDSYVPAAGASDALGGANAAYELFAALDELSGSRLVLGHTTGGAARFPPKPFGSQHIHNAARETWAVEQNYVEQPKRTNGLITVAASERIQVELRNQKRSQRAKAPSGQLIDFEFLPDGQIIVARTAASEPTIRDRIYDSLQDGKGYTVKELAAAINSDGGSRVDEESVARKLRDMDGLGQEGERKPLRHYWVQARLPAPGD